MAHPGEPPLHSLEDLARSVGAALDGDGSVRIARVATLEREFAARDSDVQRLSKQVRDLQAALDKDGATMAEAERRNKERDLANLSRDFQRSQRELREDLNLRRNEELGRIQELANKVIQQFAEAEKFDLILQDPVVYASQRIDITDKVIKALADK